MSDVVERLRAPIGYYGTNSEDGGEKYDPLRLEAADEIERLRAALEYYASGIAGRGDIARHVLKDKPLVARPIKGNPGQNQCQDD